MSMRTTEAMVLFVATVTTLPFCKIVHLAGVTQPNRSQRDTGRAAGPGEPRNGLRTYVARLKLVLWVAGLCAVGPGCGLAVQATRNVAAEVRDAVEDHRDAARAREVARATWDAHRAGFPARAYSRAYAEGFRDGVADYVTTGGAGQLLPIPPRRYLKGDYPTVQEYQALQDWLTGF